MSCDEIAAYFQSIGVRGHPEIESSCAIAIWIQHESGQMVTVSDAVATYNSRFPYELGAGPQAFICNFDKGLYPELVYPMDDYE
jgi:hypothetical protein